MPSYVPLDPPENLSDDVRGWLAEELRRISGGFEELYNAQWSPIKWYDPPNNGETDYLPATYGTFAVRQIGDFVIFRGGVAVNTATATVIGWVPDRYTPQYSQRLVGVVGTTNSTFPMTIDGKDAANPGRITLPFSGSIVNAVFTGCIYPLS